MTALLISGLLKLFQTIVCPVLYRLTLRLAFEIWASCLCVGLV